MSCRTKMNIIIILFHILLRI